MRKHRSPWAESIDQGHSTPARSLPAGGREEHSLGYFTDKTEYPIVLSQREDGTLIWLDIVEPFLDRSDDRSRYSPLGLDSTDQNVIAEMLRRAAIPERDQFVCKFSSSSPVRLEQIAMARHARASLRARCRREQLYLRKVHPRLVSRGVPTPRMIDWHWSSTLLNRRGFRNFRFIVLMENLLARGGSQYLFWRHIPFTEMEKIVRHLGRLHGRLLDLAGDREFRRLPYGPLAGTTRHRMIDLVFPGRVRRLAEAPDLPERLRQELADNEMKCMLHQLARTSARRLVRAVQAPGHLRTVVHGDCNGDNLFLVPDSDSVLLIDWQGCGINSPASELAYLLCYSFDPDRCQDLQLLAAWHSEFVRCDAAPSGYRLDDLTSEFEACMMLLLKALVAWVGSGRVSPVASLWLERVLTRTLRRARQWWQDGRGSPQNGVRTHYRKES